MFSLPTFPERSTMAQPPIGTKSPARLLTPAEAASFLSISTKTLKRLVATGALPAVRVSRSMRFDLRALEQYVERSSWR